MKNQSPLNVLDKQFIFIVGSPRSGTTWLQIMLGAHPLVCTTVELTLFSHYISPWIKNWKVEAGNITQGRWNAGLPFIWTEKEFYEFLQEFLAKVYGRVLETKPQATHILDKHPGYSFNIEDINWLLPKSRFIHIIRDGRDVAVSMICAKKQVGFGVGTIIEAAKEWEQHVCAARIGHQYPGRYLEVTFEDLLYKGEETLKTVFDFCSLPHLPGVLSGILETHQFKNMKENRITPVNGIVMYEGHYRKGQTGSWQTDLDKQQQYLFNKVAGKLLVDLNYATSDWVQSSRLLTLLYAFQYAAERRMIITEHFIHDLLGERVLAFLRTVLGRNKKGFNK